MFFPCTHAVQVTLAPWAHQAGFYHRTLALAVPSARNPISPFALLPHLQMSTISVMPPRSVRFKMVPPYPCPWHFIFSCKVSSPSDRLYILLIYFVDCPSCPHLTRGQRILSILSLPFPQHPDQCLAHSGHLVCICRIKESGNYILLYVSLISLGDQVGE